SQQVNKALAQLDQVVQQNASQAEEMSSMAEELSGQADSLQNTISFFKVDQTDGEQRRLIDRTGGNGGGHAAPAGSQHARHAGAGARHAVRAGSASATRTGSTDPAGSAAPKGEATGITIPMGGSGGAGDVHDDEFEEY
ncbi:MAG: hypothetical protein ACLFPO_07525, partial [Spirochaetaceae bacterium]